MFCPHYDVRAAAAKGRASNCCSKHFACRNTGACNLTPQHGTLDTVLCQYSPHMLCAAQCGFHFVAPGTNKSKRRPEFCISGDKLPVRIPLLSDK